MKPTAPEPVPVHSFGDWQVMPDGSIHNPRRRMVIYEDRLTDPGLLISLHANKRTATDWNNFIPAFFLACRIAQVESIPNFLTDLQ
jgi:hypothetical protein